MSKEEVALKILDLTSSQRGGQRYGDNQWCGEDSELIDKAAAMIQEYADEKIFKLCRGTWSYTCPQVDFSPRIVAWGAK